MPIDTDNVAVGSGIKVGQNVGFNEADVPAKESSVGVECVAVVYLKPCRLSEYGVIVCVCHRFKVCVNGFHREDELACAIAERQFRKKFLSPCCPIVDLVFGKLNNVCHTGVVQYAEHLSISCSIDNTAVHCLQVCDGHDPNDFTLEKVECHYR